MKLKTQILYYYSKSTSKFYYFVIYKTFEDFKLRFETEFSNRGLNEFVVRGTLVSEKNKTFKWFYCL